MIKNWFNKAVNSDTDMVSIFIANIFTKLLIQLQKLIFNHCYFNHNLLKYIILLTNHSLTGL